MVAVPFLGIRENPVRNVGWSIHFLFDKHFWCNCISSYGMDCCRSWNWSCCPNCFGSSSFNLSCCSCCNWYLRTMPCSVGRCLFLDFSCTWSKKRRSNWNHVHFRTGKKIFIPKWLIITLYIYPFQKDIKFHFTWVILILGYRKRTLRDRIRRVYSRSDSRRKRWVTMGWKNCCCSGYHFSNLD